MSRTRYRVALILALAAWLSCTGAPASDEGGAPSDAGPDSARMDGGERDTGLDTEPDTIASHDATRPDVQYDDAGPPEWVSIRGALPDFCTLDRAEHPERLNQLRVRMVPCDARDNCLESEPLAGLNEGWFGVDGTYAFGAARGPDGLQWFFTSPLDGGPPLAAYRSTVVSGGAPLCALGGAIGGGRAAFAVYFDDFSSIHGAAFYVADLAVAARIDTPILDDRTHFDSHAFPQGLYVSEGAVVAWISAGYFTDVSTGSSVSVYDAAGPSSAEESVNVVGDAILFQMDGPPTYLAIGRAGTHGGAALYHAGPGTDARVPHTDGIDIAWLEFPAGDPTGVLELWSAPFTTTPADFAPRHVRNVDVWTRPVVGAGMWVEIAGDGTPTGPHHYELYDLVDGRMRRYDLPDDIVDDQQTLYVASDRVIYPHPTLDGQRLVQFDPRLVPYDL